jgi:eukaryotic-like serine/threonine-protein kinase
MDSSSDDALRERAAFDENAAEILRLAVEKGLISRHDADVAVSDIRTRITAESSPRETPSVVDALSDLGVLDHDTLHSLAEQLGLLHGATSSPGASTDRSGDDTFSDPFDLPPVKNWDRYELVSFVGRGGMGDVWKARDPRLGRFVAIKFLRRDTPEIAHRFAREAQVQARIDHDNVCQVYEVGDVDGHAYIAMQYISGGSLKEISDLATIRDKVGIMVDVADALHAAHQAGLIHRDVKPANILVEHADDGGWRPFVVDFGIARDLDSRGDVTQSGMVLGTPAFAAPEQVRGETRTLDRRTDVYSLGATVYWFLTDRPPYDGGYPEVLAGITDREPQPPHRLNPQIPVDLETIVLKCLEKEPDRRYPTAREVSEDLRRFLSGEAITARPASLIYKITKKVRKHRGIASAAVAVVLAFALVTGLSLRTNLQARRQAAIAQRLLEQVSEIEGLVRTTSMMPLHDRREEERLIRSRMGSIEQEMARLGDLSLGPGHYALGRGYLALQDYDTALEHLEAAVATGYRTPAVSYTLGLVLGSLYERELQEARQLDNEALREAFLRDIETRYREPALEHLRSSRTSSTEVASYAEGLIAYYEGQYDEALAKARDAFTSAGWLYEAKKLEGDIYLEIGTENSFRGQYEDALREFERAGEAYTTAATIARSDASIYEGNCARWFHAMEAEVRRGHPAVDEFTNALSACGQSLQVDPDRAEIHELLARLHWRWADVVHDRGGDPGPHLERAVAAAGRAIEINPTSASAHFAMGGALTVSGLHQLAQGLDPRPTFTHAIESLERAVEHDPTRALAWDDLGYAHERVARYEMSIGLDPRSSLERAATSFRRAIELNPGYANAHNNLGIALWRQGYYELRADLDPEPSLDQALEAFGAATELNPHYAYAYANQGLAFRTKALHAFGQGRDPTPWLDQARSSLARATDINPNIFWSYPEQASVELLSARWAMDRGSDPGPLFDRAERAAARAIEVNPKNAAAYQTAAEVHRWRAEWLVGARGDARQDVATGRRLTADALRLNPALANAMVTDAALILVDAQTPDRSPDRDQMIGEAIASLDRAAQVNPLTGIEVEELRRRALELRSGAPSQTRE